MNLTNLSNSSVYNYIPNILREVEGETPLSQKLQPFIDSAKCWIEREYIGPENFLSEAHNDLAIKIVVIKAFADAAHSLDLVITPTGFGIVSTDNLAPASKDRVERLVASLQSYIGANLTTLINICKSYPEWRNSPLGQKFCGVFFSDPIGITLPDGSRLSFDELRPLCAFIENEMADRYLGHNLLDSLRDAFHSGDIPDSHKIVAGIRHAISLLVPVLDKNKTIPKHLLWYYTRPIINDLNYFPDLKEMWSLDSPGQNIDNHFVNDIKGGFYF